MKIGFVGLGKLGLPVALAIEDKGHQVKAYEVNESIKKIVLTKQFPHKENGVEKLLKFSKIEFVSMEELLETSEIIFVAVQTPHDPMFEGITRIPDQRVDFDYSYLENAIKDISKNLDVIKQEKTIVIISTVLPTTMETRIKPILSKYAKLCYNPFFIAMGTTINDFLNPEIILFGCEDKNTAKKVKEFYRTINNAPFFETSIVNAESIKVFYNTFITMKTIFGNTIMEISEHTGADCDEIINALSFCSQRIISNKYMYGGMGDSGGCHPRDNIALSYLAKKYNLSFDLFGTMMFARERQAEWLAKLMIKYEKMPKAILGKAYKPETNLIYGSSSILVKNILEEWKENILQYDPYTDIINGQVQKLTSKPHVILIGTKHESFVNFDFSKGSIILDPFGYIPKRDGIQVIHIGRNK